jgi:trans-aconitate methyltransferase
MADSDAPRIYADLAGWFHLLTAPEEYAEEAMIYTELIAGASILPPRTVLELGSGGGNNAFHMKSQFEMTLIDRSSQMLALSRGINATLEHIEGDMRTVRLDREFDAIFVHDAASYLPTEEDLRSTIETAAIHCRAGGVALFCPDDLAENFRETTDIGGHDGGGRSLRYLEWTHRGDVEPPAYVVDYAFLLRERGGEVSAVHDRHLCGAHSRATWLRLLDEAGFDARVVPFIHSEVEAGTQHVLVAVRRP